MTVLRRLALLLALEGVALVAVGAADFALGGSSTAARVAAASAVAYGGVLAGLGAAIDRRRGWARTPAVVLNVFPLPIAAGAFQSGAWWAGLPLSVLAGTALYLLFHQEVRSALA